MRPEPVEGHPSGTAQPSAEDAALARIVRREAGLIVAQLQRRLGNFDIAEEAVQEAIIVALRTWRRDGVPANPGGWLSLAARRRAIDLLRKRSREVSLADEWDADLTTSGRRDAAYGRRAIADAVRLLPSGAQRRGSAGADAASRRRHDDAADRQRFPGARGDDGAASGTRQAQDHQRRHPLHHSCMLMILHRGWMTC